MHVCISYFSVAVIDTTTRNLKEKQFSLSYGSIRIRVHHGGETWSQAGIVAGSRTWEFTSLTTSMKLREQT